MTTSLIFSLSVASVLFGPCTAAPAGVPPQGGRQGTSARHKSIHPFDNQMSRETGRQRRGSEFDKQMSTISLQ